jgi:hypothetical protein
LAKIKKDSLVSGFEQAKETTLLQFCVAYELGDLKVITMKPVFKNMGRLFKATDRMFSSFWFQGTPYRLFKKPFNFEIPKGKEISDFVEDERFEGLKDLVKAVLSEDSDIEKKEQAKEKLWTMIQIANKERRIKGNFKLDPFASEDSDTTDYIIRRLDAIDKRLSHLELRVLKDPFKYPPFPKKDD